VLCEFQNVGMDTAHWRRGVGRLFCNGQSAHEKKGKILSQKMNGFIALLLNFVRKVYNWFCCLPQKLNYEKKKNEMRGFLFLSCHQLVA